MPTRPLRLLGAGGHARVVVDALLASGFTGAITVQDDALALHGTVIFTFSVSAPVKFESDLHANFHVAIGSNAVRRRLFSAAVSAGLMPLTVLHPAVVVSPRAMVAAGVFVAARALLAPGVTVGEGAIINHASVVDHDCHIAAFAHIAPGAVLGGGVTVGESALVGAGAVVLPGKTVGAGAIIGAGAVVTKDVGDGESVVGIPARKRA